MTNYATYEQIKHKAYQGLCELFRKEYLRSGITVEYIAEVIGNNPQYIRDVMAGEVDVSYRDMCGIARAMGYRMSIDIVPIERGKDADTKIT